MRRWRPSLTGCLAGVAIGGAGRAAVVTVHLDAISAATVPALVWAAVVGAMIGGLAGLSGAPRIGAALGAVLSALAYIVMVPLALLVAVIGVATAPSLLEMMVVGAVAGFAGGVAERMRRMAPGSMRAQGRTGMKISVLVLGLGLLVTGCATTTMSDVGPTRSGFLGKDYALLTPGDVSKGEAGLRYYNPAAQWRTYAKVLIEPVTFWGDEAGKIEPADQQALGAYFNDSLQRALGEKFELATSPAPGVLRLQVAVVDATAATPGLRTVSLVVPQARTLTTASSLVTGKQAFAGALELEAKLTDAASGQLLSAVVARGVGGGSMKAAAQWKWGDAENAIDLFSKRAASNLHALTTGRATPAELPLPD